MLWCQQCHNSINLNPPGQSQNTGTRVIEQLCQGWIFSALVRQLHTLVLEFMSWHFWHSFKYKCTYLHGMSTWKVFAILFQMFLHQSSNWYWEGSYKERNALGICKIIYKTSWPTIFHQIDLLFYEVILEVLV